MLLAFALVACRLPSSSAVAKDVDGDSDTITEPMLDTGGALAVLTDEERRRVRLEPIVEAPRPSSIERPLRSTHLRLASEVTASSTCGYGRGRRLVIDATGRSRETAAKWIREQMKAGVSELAVRAPQLTTVEIYQEVPSSEDLCQLQLSGEGAPNARLELKHEYLRSLLVEDVGGKGTVGIGVGAAARLEEVVIAGGCVETLAFVHGSKIEMLGLIDVKGVTAESRREGGQACTVEKEGRSAAKRPLDLRELSGATLRELHLQDVILDGDLRFERYFGGQRRLLYLGLRGATLLGPVLLPALKPCMLDTRGLRSSDAELPETIAAWQAEGPGGSDEEEQWFDHPLLTSCSGEWLYLAPDSTAEEDWLLTSLNWRHKPTLAREYAARAHRR